MEVFYFRIVPIVSDSEFSFCIPARMESTTVRRGWLAMQEHRYLIVLNQVHLLSQTKYTSNEPTEVYNFW